MSDPQPPRPSTRRPRRKGQRRIPWGKVSWLLVLLLLLAGGFLVLQRFAAPRDTTGAQDFQVLKQEDQGPMGDRAVVLVFPQWDATGFATEERRISSRDRTGEDLLKLMGELCRGPRISGSISALPRGTKATAAFFNAETGAVVLDFSPELVTGHPGGSTAEIATLTSILRTVALNFPETRSCRILVDGAQVETLAGHLDLEQDFDPRRWL